MKDNEISLNKDAIQHCIIYEHLENNAQCTILKITFTHFYNTTISHKHRD